MRALVVLCMIYTKLGEFSSSYITYQPERQLSIMHKIDCKVQACKRGLITKIYKTLANDLASSHVNFLICAVGVIVLPSVRIKCSACNSAYRC